eukprot:TRINITY_DN21792_c0_g3_i1.p1 TRINITY_DN21792_c0_g3~~TRINITY_DN21792_c0_g3_i1.p1  ORF type:complete len:561 (-),score=140.24 TRINITY_DN21792_c0_g3_i1:88-1527(-)
MSKLKHSGGQGIIKKFAGKDGSKSFKGFKHSKRAYGVMDSMDIGLIAWDNKMTDLPAIVEKPKAEAAAAAKLLEVKPPSALSTGPLTSTALASPFASPATAVVPKPDVSGPFASPFGVEPVKPAATTGSTSSLHPHTAGPVVLATANSTKPATTASLYPSSSLFGPVPSAATDVSKTSLYPSTGPFAPPTVEASKPPTSLYPSSGLFGPVASTADASKTSLYPSTGPFAPPPASEALKPASSSLFPSGSTLFGPVPSTNNASKASSLYPSTGPFAPPPAAAEPSKPVTSLYPNSSLFGPPVPESAAKTATSLYPNSGLFGAPTETQSAATAATVESAKPASAAPLYPAGGIFGPPPTAAAPTPNILAPVEDPAEQPPTATDDPVLSALSEDSVAAEPVNPFIDPPAPPKKKVGVSYLPRQSVNTVIPSYIANAKQPAPAAAAAAPSNSPTPAVAPASNPFDINPVQPPAAAEQSKKKLY